MLLELKIENFAIIKNLEVNFNKGLNIITGETGSGKSILIEAIGVLLGSRSNKDFIRTGEKKAVLEAVFYIENQDLVEELKEQDIDLAQDRLLIINRTISIDGPSLSKINGRNINVSMLASITKHLMDIFGQHEHQSLLDINQHKYLIDSFGARGLDQLKTYIAQAYDDLVRSRRELGQLSSDKMQKDREIDILSYQIGEIQDANINLDQDQTIEEEYRKYSSLNEINTSLIEILNNYASPDPTGSSHMDKLNRDTLGLEKLARLDPALASIKDRLASLSFEMEDILREARAYLEGLSFNQNHINSLEERLNTINKLKSKYGESLEAILSFKEEAQSRLDSLENQDREIERIQADIDRLEAELLELSNKLTIERKIVAKSLEAKIQSELEYLNMKNISFKVDFKNLDDFSRDGLDKIEFLISTNMGEDLKPLSRIASGGEMSRIMLAFKSILAQHDSIETMIFDEIDTGISGETAHLVGDKILEISRLNQVICISHLPQITSKADFHYSINKEVVENKTGSYIRQLNHQERIEELARLIGGLSITDTTLENAREMIEGSRNK